MFVVLSAAKDPCIPRIVLSESKDSCIPLVILSTQLVILSAAKDLLLPLLFLSVIPAGNLLLAFLGNHDSR